MDVHLGGQSRDIQVTSEDHTVPSCQFPVLVTPREDPSLASFTHFPYLYTFPPCHFLPIISSSLPIPALLLLAMRLRDIETQSLSIQVHLVGALLQDTGNVSCILKLSEVDVTSRLLDGVSDQLSRTGLTLCADDHGLLLLTGLVDDESRALCFLLCNLLGFDGGGEFGGKGEVLEH